MPYFVPGWELSNIGASTMFTSTVITCRIMVGFIMPVARNVANMATIGNCRASPGAPTATA